MRIRDFKWSTDVFGPAFGILLLVWGALGDAPAIALVGGYLFIVMSLFALGRVERAQPDGSYKRLLSEEWHRWVDPTKIIVGFLVGSAVVSATLLLLSLSIYLAIAVGIGSSAASALAVAWVRVLRQWRQK